MVVDRKFMENKQNKPELSTKHSSFSEKFNKKIPELKEFCKFKSKVFNEIKRKNSNDL